MDTKDRMDGCVCANGAKVAEIVHPYCPAHVPPDVDAELASLRAAAAVAEAAQLPGSPMATACMLGAEIVALRAEVERLKARAAVAYDDDGAMLTIGNLRGRVAGLEAKALPSDVLATIVGALWDDTAMYVDRDEAKHALAFLDEHYPGVKS